MHPTPVGAAMTLARALGQRLFTQRLQIDTCRDFEDCQDRTHAGYPRSWLAITPTYPGAGQKLSSRQPELPPGVFSTRSSWASSHGASVTSKRSRGIERPSPSALTNASLRVQQLKNPSGLSGGLRVRYVVFSRGEKWCDALPIFHPDRFEVNADRVSA